MLIYQQSPKRRCHRSIKIQHANTTHTTESTYSAESKEMGKLFTKTEQNLFCMEGASVVILLLPSFLFAAHMQSKCVSDCVHAIVFAVSEYTQKNRRAIKKKVLNLKNSHSKVKYSFSERRRGNGRQRNQRRRCFFIRV